MDMCIEIGFSVAVVVAVAWWFALIWECLSVNSFKE